MPPDSSPDSTLAGLADSPRARGAAWAHRAGLAALVLLVGAGASGFLGPRTGDASAQGSGYLLKVHYPSITRAGQPAPLLLEVTRSGGFDGPVTLALCDELFDNLDFQAWYPSPSSEVGEPERLVYEFDPPQGEILEVSLDARTAPGQFAGVERCEVSVLEQDEPVASLDFSTWRMP